MSLRVSATLLENFRRWCDADEEYADTIEAEMIAYIKGEFTSTPAMRIGTAYHALLEYPQKHLLGHYEHSGLLFTSEAVESMLDKVNRAGTFETKWTRDMGLIRAKSGMDVVRLVAKADHLYGARGTEFKTTLSSFDSEKYLASYQWRVMMLLFELESITYHVACLKEEDSPDPSIPLYGLKSIESLNVFKYPSLETDVRSMLSDFVAYVHARKLESYLVPSWEKAAKVTA